ncbi:MAG: hypothetical protein JSR39_10970 [Verrucomicrobia bacterium]|nr:hypothetical protein [Verrucomicrobiota bacterium]
MVFRVISGVLEPVTDGCYDLLIEPFNQGYYNLRDAFQGTKIDSVAHNILDPNAPQRDLSLSERVSCAVIGILLIIPIVNTVAMAILKSVKSDLLYPTKLSDIEAMPLAPQANDPPIIPLNTGPISPEEMIARKRGALARLATIESMARPGQDAPAELNRHFRPHSQILRFNLDEVLQRYQTEHTPSKLNDFIDWAEIPDDDRRDRFRSIIQGFENVGHRSEAPSPYETIGNLLSNIAEYFSQQQARVDTGTPEETALKEQFVRVFDSLIDASNNCIDQTLAQVQALLLDVIAEGDAAGNAGSVQTKIIYRAGLALCKYRQNLLREILIRQNPDNHHMADLERAVTQRLAGVLGLQGNIFEAGAVFNFMYYLEGRVDRALQAFREEYKPMEHLLTDLSNYAGNHRTLRNEILMWANGYFDFGSETNDDGTPAAANLPDGTPAPHMDARISEDFAALPASEGGNLKISAVALMLETLGLVRPTTA